MGTQPAVQAETCPECRGYLKLCRLDRDPHLDPWADDLATLALDLLVDQEGFERAGLNFLLLQGGRRAAPAMIPVQASVTLNSAPEPSSNDATRIVYRA